MRGLQLVERTDLVLHSLRVKGAGDVADIAVATGESELYVRRALEGLERAGLAARRDWQKGILWSMTPDGRAHHAKEIASRLTPKATLAVLQAAYRDFVAVNEPFKTLCTDAQLGHVQRADAVGEALRPIHDRVGLLLSRAEPAGARFGVYKARFDGAWRRLGGGDLDALTKPLSRSYHDTWMELHEDLLVSLGITRSARDGA